MGAQQAGRAGRAQKEGIGDGREKPRKEVKMKATPSIPEAKPRAKKGAKNSQATQHTNALNALRHSKLPDVEAH